MKELAVFHSLLAFLYLYLMAKRGIDESLVICATCQFFIAWCQWESYRRAKE